MSGSMPDGDYLADGGALTEADRAARNRRLRGKRPKPGDRPTRARPGKRAGSAFQWLLLVLMVIFAAWLIPHMAMVQGG
jgi:hypothetical protein